MSDSYDIGYGKPPRASQWRKGQSGNPRGRPKTRADHIQDAAAILSEPVKAWTPEGKTVSLDGIEVAYLALCKRGLKGNVPALIRAINMMLEVQPVLDSREAEERQIREDVITAFQKMGIEFDPADLS